MGWKCIEGDREWLNKITSGTTEFTILLETKDWVHIKNQETTLFVLFYSVVFSTMSII